MKGLAILYGVIGLVIGFIITVVFGLDDLGVVGGLFGGTAGAYFLIYYSAHTRIVESLSEDFIKRYVSIPGFSIVVGTVLAGKALGGFLAWATVIILALISLQIFMLGTSEE